MTKALKKPDLTSFATPSQDDHQQLLDRLLVHIDNPVECFYDTWWDYLVDYEKETGIEPDKYLDNWQKEVLMATVEYNYVAVTGGNNVGKSTVSSIFTWTYMKTRPSAVGQCTSVDSIQLSHVLWAELSRWHQRSPELKAAFSFAGHSFKHKKHPDEWWMLARTARKQSDSNLKDGGKHATGLQGIHAPHVIMVIDEASGVEDPNWESAESSIREPDNKLFAISNPLRVSGRMFQVFHLEHFRKFWYTRQVSYLECPRIDKKMAAEQIEMLGGLDSPVVQIRFLGQFPKRGADDTLPTYDQVSRSMARSRQIDGDAINILLRLMDAGINVECHYDYDTLKGYLEKFSNAQKENDFLPEYLYRTVVRMPKPPKLWLDMVADYFSGPCRMGVDLARYGSSESVFAVRRGYRIVQLMPRFNVNSIQVEAIVEDLYKFYSGMDLVIVDKTGLYGESVCDHLALKKIPTLPVGFGENAITTEDFKNQATEMWFEVANNIEKITMPYDSHLLSQLTTRPYYFTGKGTQKIIQDKETMKRQAKLPSPDRADAVGLAFKRVQIIVDNQLDQQMAEEYDDDENILDYVA